ncbi:hypothetical protein J3E64_001127 [Sphingobium sp. OAS761]|uniref:hypothetical protein n=1 Tax=unclassified Sphingobium TaxID=2611147 RepID=UPI0020A22B92|nr:MULTISPECIES: hypothetical protein [unclassified Sphingobium]MCP1469452.1 hypothetical protein [Sphingobium sp. OAS761]
MLSNRPEKGLDLLDAMVTAAADRASSHLPGAIRFAKCDGLQINEGFSAPDVEIEAWSLSADQQAIIVSVFATGAREDGGRTTAATGRFTFTTLTGQREYRA